MKAHSIPALPCMCANLRRASRAISQLYDKAMRPMGLTITQFTILQVLTLAGEVSQGRLGEILAMDSTTLTRTLRILRKHGWIASHRGADRRERRLSLSSAGRAEFHHALPRWQSAQAQLRARIGKTRWNRLANFIHQVTSVVAE
jgi:DNA-binding MarR family transcriptional regulator